MYIHVCVCDSRHCLHCSSGLFSSVELMTATFCFFVFSSFLLPPFDPEDGGTKGLLVPVENRDQYRKHGDWDRKQCFGQGTQRLR